MDFNSHQTKAPSTSGSSLIRKKICFNCQSETHLRNQCLALNKKNFGPLMEQDYNTRTQKGMTKRLAREFVNNTLGGPKKANLQPVPLTQGSTDKDATTNRTDAINIRRVMEQHRAANVVCQIQPMISQPKPLTRTDRMRIFERNCY
ncbi:unnamed protein product [Gordionus sp. m RMFG-2023]